MWVGNYEALTVVVPARAEADRASSLLCLLETIC